MTQTDFQILDEDGNYLRSVKEGEMRLRFGGRARAWIPDRRPGESNARLVRDDGTLLAVAGLADSLSELGE